MSDPLVYLLVIILATRFRLVGLDRPQAWRPVGTIILLQLLALLALASSLRRNTMSDA
jgi:hypothetical protein